jgi:hypothetical protein
MGIEQVHNSRPNKEWAKEMPLIGYHPTISTSLLETHHKIDPGWNADPRPQILIADSQTSLLNSSVFVMTAAEQFKP